MPEQKHVLIVENDGHIRDLLATALKEYGYRVSTAREGVAARAVLAASIVDLLLADVVLPGESGLQLAEHARTLGIPYLLMSGELKTKAALMDHRAFLGKPFKLRDLTERMIWALANRPASFAPS